jgi:hypothetical protein
MKKRKIPTKIAALVAEVEDTIRRYQMDEGAMLTVPAEKFNERSAVLARAYRMLETLHSHLSEAERIAKRINPVFRAADMDPYHGRDLVWQWGREENDHISPSDGGQP